MTLTAENIAVVAAAVLALTQLLKWGRLVTDERGPLAVLALSLVGVLLFQVSQAPDGSVFGRGDIWPIFSAWIVVSLTAAGAFGFTRASADAVTATRSPPPGAAQNPTVKS